MEKFKKQIYKKCSAKIQSVDNTEFLFKLETRIRQSKENRKIFKMSFLLLFFLSILTVTQFSEPYDQDILFYIYGAETNLGTDLWNLDKYSIDYDEEFYDDVTYYILDEYYTWETLEFIHEILLKGRLNYEIYYHF